MARNTSAGQKQTGQTQSRTSRTDGGGQPGSTTQQRGCNGDNAESGRRRRKAVNVDFGSLSAKRKKVSVDDAEVLQKVEEVSDNGSSVSGSSVSVPVLLLSNI